MVKTKKQMFTIIGVFALVMMIGTVTFAFFNYTRTGGANTIKTGRIYFNTTQNGTLNITNLFPMSSTDGADASKNPQVVTVNIVGDTTYANGEEFEISLVSVNDTVGQAPNTKKLPISYVATYEATPVEPENPTNEIGSPSATYATSRGASSPAIYKLNATGTVSEGKQVLVGYIPTGATGINGTLSIRAYLDASNIAISDTYPEKTVYLVNGTGFTQTACETATGLTGGVCASADALQGDLDNATPTLTSAQIRALETAGLVTEYTDGTTSEWVNGRTVLTTTEWNSLQNTQNPISFKIRAISNEGTWVSLQPTLALTSSTVEVESTTTLTSDGDGTLTCTSSDDTIATCSVSGGTATIEGVAAGTATITVVQAAGTNYTAVPSTTYGITVVTPQQP